MTSQKTETKATNFYGFYLTRVVSNKFFELKREINMVKLTKLGHLILNHQEEGNKKFLLDFSTLERYNPDLWFCFLSLTSSNLLSFFCSFSSHAFWIVLALATVSMGFWRGYLRCSNVNYWDCDILLNFDHCSFHCRKVSFNSIGDDWISWKVNTYVFLRRSKILDISLRLANFSTTLLGKVWKELYACVNYLLQTVLKYRILRQNFCLWEFIML